MSKNVTIEAHSFDCLPGHAVVVARGTGSNLRVALGRAMEAVTFDPKLAHKRVHSFKASVVITESGGTSADQG